MVMSGIWISTPEMASRLGVHPKTLLKLRRCEFSPFREGVHFRRGGLSTLAPLQWETEAAERAFTSFRRIDPAQVETFASARA